MEREQLTQAIWEMHVPMLRLAMSILRHTQNAEDAVSQAVVSAYARCGTLRNPEALKPWLMKITARCCYDLLRRRKREVLMESIPPPAAVFEEPLGDTLFDKLQELPNGQAQVLLLYYYDGFSTAEIAAVLGLSRPGVSMRLKRGRERLREQLAAEVNENETV